MVTPQELKGLGMFEALDEQELAQISAMARELACSAGDTLFQEGDLGSQIYILLEGSVSIRVMLSSRPESIVVASLNRPGQLVGWSGLVSQTYTASAVCESESRLLAINGQELHAALQANPHMGYHVMDHVAQIIGERLRNIQRVVLKTL